MDPVRFFPLLPMTANEAAWKRVRGAEALQERWLRQGRTCVTRCAGGALTD